MTSSADDDIDWIKIKNNTRIESTDFQSIGVSSYDNPIFASLSSSSYIDDEFKLREV